MEIIPLHWDSDFFGLRIAKAVVASDEDVVSLSRQEGDLRKQCDLIYIFSDLVNEMPFPKARLVDKKAVFSLTAPGHLGVNPAIKRWDSQITTASLVSLALVSGKYSRFKLDKNLPAGSYERLYTRWMEQSVNGAIATDVFCYMLDGAPRGVVTLDFRDGQGVIGLVAVAEEYQHRGIGKALIRHAISYVHDQQGERLSVATQMDNESACRLYSGCGFSLDSITKIYHWWL